MQFPESFTQNAGGANLSFKSKFDFDKFCVIPSTSLLAVGGRRGFCVWELDSSGFLAVEKSLGDPFRDSRLDEKTVTSISASRGGWIAARVSKGIGLLWKDMESLRIVEATGKQRVDRMVLSPDGKWVAVVVTDTENVPVSLYRTFLYATGDLFRKGIRADRKLDLREQSNDISFSPESDRLALTSRCDMGVYSLSPSGWCEVTRISAKSHMGLSFGREGPFASKLLFVAALNKEGDSDLLYADLEEQSPATKIVLKHVQAFTITRDGAHVTASNERSTFFLTTETKEIRQWSRHDSGYARYCLSPHGAFIATHSGRTLQLRDVGALGTFEVESFSDCAFTWDQNWFIIARANQEILVWDMAFLRSSNTPNYSTLTTFREEGIRTQ